MAVPAAQRGRTDTQWPLTVKDRIFQAAREHQLRATQRQQECKRRAQVRLQASARACLQWWHSGPDW